MMVTRSPMPETPTPAATPVAFHAHSAQTWDIFCTVIDNYGDIGVCWRLARQLAGEFGLGVRLWVDDLHTFARICPQLVADRAAQSIAGVDVRHWTTPFPACAPGDVVIEAFACALPESFEAAMALRNPAPFWINLEYLSAEAWPLSCHGLPSPHPRLPLTKHFFFPGLVRESGGLLREQGLVQRLDRLDRDHWWAEHGGATVAGSLNISLFAYENRAAAGLVEAWRQGDTAITCLLTDSRIRSSLAAALDETPAPGTSLMLGKLELRALPFMPQDDYDTMLATCDLNFVRGEDSLVRAIWSGKPFVWHIYQQEDGAHHIKLDAFLDAYCAGLQPEAANALSALWRSWNEETTGGHEWQAYRAHWPALLAHARSWRDSLAATPDLASRLFDFCRQK